MLLISAPGRLRKADYKHKANLGYKVRPEKEKGGETVHVGE